MKFNISFLGPEPIAHLRRDLMLLLKASLEDLGHHVVLSQQSVETGYVNILVGAYFLKPEHLTQILQSGVEYYNLNTEVIRNDMMNFNPDKVDFMGSYLPFIRKGKGLIEMVPDNNDELDRYGLHHAFLRWSYHPILEDVNRAAEKDLDFYFFGMMSERRQQMLLALQQKGFKGAFHHSCPNHVRNSYIERAKIVPNIIQQDIYTHVNAFRIGYLVNNACAVLSEREHDPVGFQNFVKVCSKEDFVEAFAALLPNTKTFGEEQYEAYRKITMKEEMKKTLEILLGGAKKS